MTVINPNSISGITSITLPAGADNVLTIHTNDGVERFRIDSTGNIKVGTAATISPDGDLFVTGVCTATTLAGAASGLTGTLPAISGANLTNLLAANLTGTLPAISATNLTSIPAANVTGTLPAISGANLTSLTAANLSGALPAISAASCTSIPAANIVGLATAGFNRSGGFPEGDYVKLQRATSGGGSGDIIFDDLDVATYKFFDFWISFVPESDGTSVYFRFRTGGSSGTDVNGANYGYGYAETYPSNNSCLLYTSPSPRD